MRKQIILIGERFENTFCYEPLSQLCGNQGGPEIKMFVGKLPDASLNARNVELFTKYGAYCKKLNIAPW